MDKLKARHGLRDGLLRRHGGDRRDEPKRSANLNYGVIHMFGRLQEDQDCFRIAATMASPSPIVINPSM